MKLPFTSLNAATSTGPGTSRDLERPTRLFTMVVSATGSPSSVSVDLEGSLDGSFWFALVRRNDIGAATVGDSAGAHFVRYVRANALTLSGGSSPTLTAVIAPIDEDL